MKKLFFLSLLLALCYACDSSSSGEETAIQSESNKKYDLLLIDGTVVDGLGNERFVADVAIKGDKIVLISKESIDPSDAVEVIKIGGKVLSPGFIDNHAHVQNTIHQYPLAENFTRQGITSIIASLHSHDQPWPLDEYASSLDIAPNVGFFAGHTWTRKQVIGMENRAPTKEELDSMRYYVEETMKQGALGLSTGLLYVPANFAQTEEIIELAKIASRYGGIYITHMRNEASGLLNSVRETIRIAEAANIPAQINHHKAVGVTQWGWSERSLALIDSANAAGMDIRHDLYPYTASSTTSAILFPQWAFGGGRKGFVKNVNNTELRSKLDADMKKIFETDRTGNDLRRIQFRILRSDPSYNGKTMGDLAADRGLPNNVETGIALAKELQLKGGFSAIYHAMEESDVINIMQHPLAMFETDGDPVAYGIGYPHPRSYGAFPRVLARYVRELKVLTLEEAIKKMTSMPADQFNQKQRGRIQEGAFADIVVFDPETIQDKATFIDPHQYAVGIDHVIINGEFVIKAGSFTGERPGRWLKGPARD